MSRPSWLSSRARSHLPLVALVVAEAVWLTGLGAVRGPLAWVPLVAVLVGHDALSSREQRSPTLPAASVLAAAMVVLAVAVALPAAGSRDLYQYAFYGRMARHFGADPYVVAPHAFRLDPLYHSLAPGWHHARSAYGPLFTWLSAVGSAWFGASPLLARLWFQGLAAVATLAAASAIIRRHGPAAGLSVALSPVMVAAVNGGHNDVLTGALVLVGVLLATDERPFASGLAFALASAVKASALPMVGAVWLVWVHRRQARALVCGALAWGGATVALYAWGGGLHVLEPLRAVAGRTSRASAWSLLERVAGDSAFGGSVLRGAGVVTVLLTVAAAWRWRRWGHGAAGTAAGAVSCFAAPYVLAWYPAVIVPVAGTLSRARAERMVRVGASALLLAYVVPAGEPPAAVPLASVAAVACGVVLAAVVGRFVRARCPLSHGA